MTERNINRRDFFKIVGGATLAAFSESCQHLSKEDIDKIPQSSVSELVGVPESFINKDIIKTAGFVTEGDPKKYQDSATGLTYPYTHMEIDSEVHVYVISESLEANASKLNAVSANGLTDYKQGLFGEIEVKLSDKFPQPEKGKKYEIIGRLKKSHIDEGPVYFFEIAKIVETAK